MAKIKKEKGKITVTVSPEEVMSKTIAGKTINEWMWTVVAEKLNIPLEKQKAVITSFDNGQYRFVFSDQEIDESYFS